MCINEMYLTLDLAESAGKVRACWLAWHVGGICGLWLHAAWPAGCIELAVQPYGCMCMGPPALRLAAAPTAVATGCL
jgi:hypothetical protein